MAYYSMRLLRPFGLENASTSGACLGLSSARNKGIIGRGCLVIRGRSKTTPEGIATTTSASIWVVILVVVIILVVVVVVVAKGSTGIVIWLPECAPPSLVIIVLAKTSTAKRTWVVTRIVIGAPKYSASLVPLVISSTKYTSTGIIIVIPPPWFPWLF